MSDHDCLLEVDKSVNENARSEVDGEVTTLAEMSDGERLNKLLDDHHKAHSDLERAMGKSRQMVNRYLHMDHFSPNTRTKIKEGLQRLGIEADGLDRSVSSVMDPTELRQLLDGIPHESLRNVKRMLDADRATKVALVALIDDRLERKR